MNVGEAGWNSVPGQTHSDDGEIAGGLGRLVGEMEARAGYLDGFLNDLINDYREKEHEWN